MFSSMLAKSKRQRLDNFTVESTIKDTEKNTESQCDDTIVKTSSKSINTLSLQSNNNLKCFDWKDEAFSTPSLTALSETDKLWEVQLRPTDLNGIMGQDAAKLSMEDWYTNFSNKALLLSGPSGCGKTILSHAFLNLKNYKVCDEGDINEAIEKFNVSSLLPKKQAILIECVEGLMTDEKSKLLKAIKSGKKLPPIIITCDDNYSQSLRPLKDACFNIVMKPLSQTISRNILMNSAKNIGKPLSSDSADSLIEAAHGNVRHAINNMQFMILTKNRKKIDGAVSALVDADSSWDLFSSTSKLCCGVYDEKSEDIASSDIELAMLMLHHNGPSSARTIQDCASALDSISLSDILMKEYNTNLALTISTQAVAQACKGSRTIPKIFFPTYLGKMSSRKSRSSNLRIAAGGTLPTSGPLLTVKNPDKYKITTIALKGFVSLQQIHPSSFISHDYLLARNAYAKGLKLSELKSKQLFVEPIGALDVVKKGVWTCITVS